MCCCLDAEEEAEDGVIEERSRKGRDGWRRWDGAEKGEEHVDSARRAQVRPGPRSQAFQQTHTQSNLIC